MLVSWLLSNIFTILFYKAFHPWSAINGSRVRAAALCECGRGQMDELPDESDIEMDHMISVGASCD